MLAELDHILAVRDSLVTCVKRPPHMKPPMGSVNVGRTKNMKMAIGTDHINWSVSVKL